MGFCPDSIWDSNLTWNTTNPSLTTCFKETALAWLPCTIIWIGAAIEWARLGRKPNISPPWNLLQITKFVFSMILIIISVIQTSYALSYRLSGLEVYPVEYVSPLIRSLSFCIASVLILVYRKKGVHTSPLLVIFWLFFTVYAITDYKRLFTKYIANLLDESYSLDRMNCVIKMIFFPIVASQFLFSFFADVQPEYIFPNINTKEICPIDYCSFPSQLTFFWVNPLIRFGFKKPLQTEDMWILHSRFNTEKILERFDKYWQPAWKRSRELLQPVVSLETDEKTSMLQQEEGGQARSKKDLKPRINILGPLLRTYWPDMLYLFILKLISSLLMFVGPTVLDYLITFINSDEPQWRGFFYTFLLFLSAFVDSMLSNQYEFGVNCLGMKVKSSLISTVYKKALRLSSAGRSSYTTGQIVNIMAVDTMYIYNYVNTYNLIWACPLQIIICLKKIWTQLGVGSLGGYGVIIFMIPVNAFITMKIKRFQTEMMKCNASRLKLMNQLLNGIKVLKLYAWEKSFNTRIGQVREQEVQYLKQTGYYLAGITFAFTCTPFFIAAASFGTFVLIDSNNVLTPTKAFVSLSLFNLLTAPLAILPMAITFAVLFFVSLGRVNRFLDADELDLEQVQRAVYAPTNTIDPTSDDAIVIEHASFTWSRDKEISLKQIDLKIRRNKLIAVVGQVGAGKSSLFSALLGEMHKIEGHVRINGTVSYVPQEAWIQNATLKNNILFGNPFQLARYETILAACALKPDLEVLDAGDQTEIGEKGINLSGGQKQRVSLARACYNDADIYLMDDPLSAVDTHVGKHLFEKVIGQNGYLRNKTRVLITHKVTLLPFVDEIVVMKNCEITERGSYHELLEQKGAFAEILSQYVAEIEQAPDEVDEDEATILENIKKQIDLSSSGHDQHRKSFSQSNRMVRSTSLEKHHNSHETSTDIKKRPSAVGTTGGRLTTDEKNAVGKVKWSVYVQYLGAVSLGLICSTLIGFVIHGGLNIARSLWLSAWSNDALDPAKAMDVSLRNERLLVYTGIGLGETVLILFTAISLNLAFVKASRHLHLSMLKRLVVAPLTFFDTTPMGRVLNRFSEDLNITDVTLRINFRMLMVLGMRTITSFIIMGISTPIFFFALIPLAFIYNIIQKYYLASSRQLKRIESTSRSPIFTHFSETVMGCSSIRAYGVAGRFLDECHRRIDMNNRCSYPGFAAGRWMTVRLEFIGYCVVLTAATLTVLYRHQLSPGLAGLSITYALSITTALNMLIKAFVDVETNIVAVERCIEFTKIPIETDQPDCREIERDWPLEGRIEFNDYCARYRKDLNTILNNLTFTIQPGEKVGIIGRTGSGKSSLTLALFRMIERTSGSIRIDGIDIENLAALELRSRLTIIPQDPFVFSGTIRANLDPFDQYSDESIWKALEHSHLKSHVDSLPGGISFELTESGDNLSVGQRQLVCLARALLRKTKVLILDEATAAIDFETDELIQKTIRTEFAECTILTIAHRLNTIIDYDRILLLDDGRLVEFASPRQLLADTKSRFYQMAKEAKLV